MCHDTTSLPGGWCSTHKNDTEFNLDKVGELQKECNAHVSMLIKTFRFGQDWKHGQRHRETKINKSWNAPDLSLLAKDNKKWDPTKGPIPTRAVVGANQGQNVHLSDVVSDILEPLATCMISMEANSSEDWFSNIDEYNMKVKAKVTIMTI